MSAPEIVPAAESKPERPRPEIVKGWKRIARLLEVSRKTAMGYAARDVDPLPTYYDHAERPRIYLSALMDWIDRQAMFYRTFHQLRAAGRLPRQVKRDAETRQRQRRTKVAHRVAKKTET